MISSLEKISFYTSRLLIWLLLAMMLISFVVVVLRYGFGIGSIALQESISYCHAAVFLLGAAYTLQQDTHVRVDIFYQHFSPQQKAWVNALGTLLFLIPLCLFLLLTSWTFFTDAWNIREGSPDPGGLPFLYLLKGLIPLSMLLLLTQAIVLLFQSAAVVVLNKAEH